MPFEHPEVQASEQLGLNGVFRQVDDISGKLVTKAGDFEHHVTELKKSPFYSYMKELQQNILA